MSQNKHPQYQICVSGAARGSSVEQNFEIAKEMGKLIAEAGHILLTGATIGLPYAAAQGAKSAGGTSIGISPAASRHAHERKYRLPTDAFDVILYTGLHYVGRDTLLINCSEAVVSIGGRMGTTHEFTIAMESHKPVGVVEGAGGVSDILKELVLLSHNSNSGVVFETNPAVLLKKLIKQMDEKYSRLEESSTPLLGKRLS